MINKFITKVANNNKLTKGRVRINYISEIIILVLCFGIIGVLTFELIREINEKMLIGIILVIIGLIVLIGLFVLYFYKTIIVLKKKADFYYIQRDDQYYIFYYDNKDYLFGSKNLTVSTNQSAENSPDSLLFVFSDHKRFIHSMFQSGEFKFENRNGLFQFTKNSNGISVKATTNQNFEMIKLNFRSSSNKNILNTKIRFNKVTSKLDLPTDYFERLNLDKSILSELNL